MQGHAIPTTCTANLHIVAEFNMITVVPQFIHRADHELRQRCKGMLREAESQAKSLAELADLAERVAARQAELAARLAPAAAVQVRWRAASPPASLLRCSFCR